MRIHWITEAPFSRTNVDDLIKLEYAARMQLMALFVKEPDADEEALSEIVIDFYPDTGRFVVSPLTPQPYHALFTDYLRQLRTASFRSQKPRPFPKNSLG